MPTWTKADLIAYEQRRKNSAGGSGLCAAKPERATGVPLERVASGKDQGSGSIEERDCRTYRVTYTVYSQRPNDFDNIRIKELQDILILANLIPDDNWQILSGSVVSKKAHSKAEERTEVVIEIEACQPSPKA